MEPRWRLPGAALLIAVAWLFAPSLTAGFRSEDFVDFEYYSRASLWQVVTGTHLGMEMLHFWRPLADLVTWLLVRVVGPHSWPLHFLLLLLLVATAAAAGRAMVRTFGLSAGAGWAAALLVVVHPFAPAVLTYFDGGVPTLLLGWFALVALGELGRWRAGEKRGGTLFWTSAAACLCYDLGLLVPVLLCVVGWILPRGTRRAPCFVLLLIPAVVALRMLLGVGFRGYPIVPDRSMVVDLPERLATVCARLFVPVFPGALHSHGCFAGVLVIFGGVIAAAIAIAIATRRGSAWTALRQAAALAVLVLGLLAAAPLLFLLNKDQKPDELVLAYQSWPAAAAAALATAWLFGRSAGRRGFGALVLALPWAATLLVLRAPVTATHEEALRWAQGLCDGVSANAAASGATRLLVFDVPVANRRGEGEAARTITRVLQWGLGASQRPPCRTPAVDAYPVFRESDDMLKYVSRETLDALAASPFLLPVRCSTSPAVHVEAIERPAAPAGAGTLRLSADADGRGAAPLADLAEAPLVSVAAGGSADLYVAGAASGELRLFFLNRLHPCYARRVDPWPGRPPAMELERVPQPGAAADRLHVRVEWLEELASRYPDDVVFVVLEALSDRAQTPGARKATVSNVLPVRLRRAARAAN